MASLDLRRQKIYRDTTIPLDGQSENIFDPIETATPSSKRKQVSLFYQCDLAIINDYLPFRLWPLFAPR